LNERIKQLAEQAGLVKILDEHASEYGNGMFENTPYPELEKFAQLIVRECVGVADDYVKDCTCDEHKNCKHPRSAIGRKIREHFGVEE
jgi:hypothetical protein